MTLAWLRPRQRAAGGAGRVRRCREWLAARWKAPRAPKGAGDTGIAPLTARVGCAAQEAPPAAVPAAKEAAGSQHAEYAPLTQAHLPFGPDRRKKVRDGHKYDAMYTVTESGEWYLNPEPGARVVLDVPDVVDVLDVESQHKQQPQTQQKGNRGAPSPDPTLLLD